MRDVDLTQVHYLTGPFDIEGAEPGDVLLVDIQDVQPLEDQPWGFTGVFAKENGGGFLDELYPKPYVLQSLFIVREKWRLVARAALCSQSIFADRFLSW